VSTIYKDSRTSTDDSYTCYSNSYTYAMPAPASTMTATTAHGTATATDTPATTQLKETVGDNSYNVSNDCHNSYKDIRANTTDAPR
jgi:hypothetical protein